MTRAGQLVAWLVDSRTRTFELLAELDDAAVLGEPELGLAGPTWLVGHLVWLYAHHVLGDHDPEWSERFDPGRVPAGRRFTDAGLEELLPRSAEIQNRVLHAIMEPAEVPARLSRMLRVTIEHEDWVGEQLVAWFQARGGEAPQLIFDDDRPAPAAASRVAGAVELAAGRYAIGSDADEAGPYERGPHDAVIEAVRISRTPVTETRFAEFADAGGYQQREHWSPQGWAWLQERDRSAPRYWARRDGVWFRRDFDRWDELDERRPVVYVSAFEAEAFCAWEGSRLPTEHEWEVAAAFDPAGAGEPRVHPWGAHPFKLELALLDGRQLWPASVDDFSAGDSGLGARQMLGNVWEWTASPMRTYPGYQRGLEAELSPAEGRVIRGGSFATRSRFATAAMRRGLPPGEDRMPTGFRTAS